MKKFLVIIVIIAGHYNFGTEQNNFGIKSNLMYGLGGIKNVPTECNPVIGLSFLKLGLIKSWIESAHNNPVVDLTNKLFTLDGDSIKPIVISYLDPESIGHILKIIEEYKNSIDKLKPALLDYFKKFDTEKISNEDLNILSLLVDALHYIVDNTLYPQGSLQALLLAYLCSISQSRDDIQKYYQGFLNDPDFVLSEKRKSGSTVSNSTKDKDLVKNCFCLVPQVKELQIFLDTFAQKNRSYDALDKLVLLFFNYRNGKLVPDTLSSNFINAIPVASLGMMMRLINDNKDSLELLKVKLQDYLAGLKIIDKRTGQLLDSKSFDPLVLNLVGSITLTQGNNPKYSYDFFENILGACICSRLATIKDIKDYTNGLFEYSSPKLLEQQEAKFACCITKKAADIKPKDDSDNKHQESSSRSQDDHEKKDEVEISDALVERTILLDLEKAQVENSVEAVIFEVFKIAQLKEESKNKNKKSSTQAYIPFVGGYYSIKNRQKRQQALDREVELFNQMRDKLKNIPGVSYQRVEKDGETIAIAVGSNNQSNEDSNNDSSNKDSNNDQSNPSDKNTKSSNESKPGDQNTPTDDLNIKENDSAKKSDDSNPESKNKRNTTGSSTIKKINRSSKYRFNKKIIHRASPLRPVLMETSGFIPGSGSSDVVPNIGSDTVQIDIQNTAGRITQSLSLRDTNGQIIIPAQSGLTCAGMQPTMTNVVLALEEALNIQVVPGQDVHLLIDPLVAGKYLNEIGKSFNIEFDVTNFDFTKSFIVKMGKNKIVVNFDMQRTQVVNNEESKQIGNADGKSSKTKSIIELPTAMMQIEDKRVVPIEDFQPSLDITKLITVLNLITMQESLVASIILTGMMEVKKVEEYKKFLDVVWINNIQLIVEAQKALFEFTSLMMPKPYDLVQFKINQIMSGDNDLVAIKLFNLFTTLEITEGDIDSYFEHAPVEKIVGILHKIDKWPDYNFNFLNGIPSKSLSSLFERVSILDLEDFTRDLKPNQKFEIFKKLPQSTLKNFIDDLNLEEFNKFFGSMNSAETIALKISDTENITDSYYQKFLNEQNKNISPYLTMAEIKNLSAQQLQELAQQRKEAIDNFGAPETRFSVSSKGKGVLSKITPQVKNQGYIQNPWYSAPLTQQNQIKNEQLNTRRHIYSLEQIKRKLADTMNKSLAEKAGEIVRAVGRGAIHGLK